MSLQGGANRDQQDFQVTVAAGLETTINVAGEFVNVIQCNLSSFLMAWDQDPKTYAEKGTKRRLGQGDVFRSLVIDNSENASSLTVRIVAGFGDYESAVEINGAVSLAGALSTPADVSALATATTLLSASNTSRKEILISNPAGSGVTLRIGDSNAGAARGIPLAAGQTIALNTTGAVYAYNPSAGAVACAVLEITA